jgi:hypothetical protein
VVQRLPVKQMIAGSIPASEALPSNNGSSSVPQTDSAGSEPAGNTQTFIYDQILSMMDKSSE